jgi:hypothetical protein
MAVGGSGVASRLCSLCMRTSLLRLQACRLSRRADSNLPAISLASAVRCIVFPPFLAMSTTYRWELELYSNRWTKGLSLASLVNGIVLIKLGRTKRQGNPVVNRNPGTKVQQRHGIRYFNPRHQNFFLPDAVGKEKESLHGTCSTSQTPTYLAI